MQEYQHFLRAIEILGNPSRLAAATGYSQHAVWHALHVRKSVSPKMAIAIDRATKGEVKKSELRPDIFGADA